MNTCTLTGTLVHIDNKPMSFARIRAYIDAQIGFEGVTWPTETTPGRDAVTTYSNKAGDFSLVLGQGLCVLVELPGTEIPQRLLVPELSTARLVDYLYIRAIAVDWAELILSGSDWVWQDLTFTAPDTIEVPAGDTINIGLRATWSNQTFSAYGLAAWDTVPSGFPDAADAQGREITLATPGSVVATRVSTDTELSATAFSSIPTLLLPESNYIIPLPDALNINFV